jgi:hypothetical protein
VRFGRILLASLTALAAYGYAHGTSSRAEELRPDPLPRLLQAVVPLFICAADCQDTASDSTTSSHAVFELEALTDTRLGGSVWLLQSLQAVDLHARRHPPAFLRC